MLSDPLQQYLMIGVAAFVAGYLVAMLGRVVSNRAKKEREDPRDHRIRALEADLRLAERQASENDTQTSDAQTHQEEALAKITELQAAVVEADAELQKLKQDLKTSCEKTVELRQELTDRAEQTIRGRAQLDDLKTELEVAKAGTDAVVDEINRLNQESEDRSEKVKRPKKLVTDK